jgi:hypothetical protein
MENSPITSREIYQNATLGVYGKNILAAGATSADGRKYIAVTATEVSVISYDNAIAPEYTYGDASVANLEIAAGMTVILGVIKNVHVISGNVIANLISRP